MAARRGWLPVTGDLGVPKSLRPAVDGADLVVHAAAYLGRDRDVAEAVSSTAAGVILLGEPLTAGAAAGACIILTGAAMFQGRRLPRWLTAAVRRRRCREASAERALQRRMPTRR